jgi:sortase A
MSGFFLSQMVQGEVARVEGIERFELAWSAEAPDQSLWSEERIAAWQASKAAAPEDVIGVLSMPDLGLRVPVYDDDSDLSMDRGAGWIAGTAGLEEGGNTGIAGHRDGYFRVLKDAEIGDNLVLQTRYGARNYRVEEILIVDPLDVEVLDPSDDSQVTLVTCYPFYFVGSAPQRYIVKAQQVDEVSSNQ